jgi:hypothetical protein
MKSNVRLRCPGKGFGVHLVSALLRPSALPPMKRHAPDEVIPDAQMVHADFGERLCLPCAIGDLVPLPDHAHLSARGRGKNIVMQTDEKLRVLQCHDQRDSGLNAPGSLGYRHARDLKILQLVVAAESRAFHSREHEPKLIRISARGELGASSTVLQRGETKLALHQLEPLLDQFRAAGPGGARLVKASVGIAGRHRIGCPNSRHEHGQEKKTEHLTGLLRNDRDFYSCFPDSRHLTRDSPATY